MNELAQNRPVKDHRQEQDARQTNDEPADPASMAVWLDSALSIFAHEAANLFPPLTSATAFAFATVSGLTFAQV